MNLNEGNYFSKEAMTEYCSVSQLKAFIGCPAKAGCEERELAKLHGLYEEEHSDALTIGSYVDIALTGTPEEMEQFMERHPEIFSSRGATKGQLLAKYQNANDMVERAKKDKKFMATLSGEHQRIMVGELFGVPFKVKLDSLLPNAIVDLKTVASIRETHYDPVSGRRMNFIEWWDYILQMAVYQEIVRQNTGNKLPCFISAISKEKTPDIEVIHIPDELMEERLFGNPSLGIPSLEDAIQNVQLLKQGIVKPEKCCSCDYCKSKKEIIKPISFYELGGEVG